VSQSALEVEDGQVFYPRPSVPPESRGYVGNTNTLIAPMSTGVTTAEEPSIHGELSASKERH
jgi:hypothetical protein